MTDDPKPMLARLKAEYAAVMPGEWPTVVLIADTYNCLPALLALGDDAIRFREALEGIAVWLDRYINARQSTFEAELKDLADVAAKLRAVLARKGSEGEG
jgi:hypothetical protein